MTGPEKGCLLDEWGPDIDYLGAVGEAGCLAEEVEKGMGSGDNDGDEDE